MRTRPGRAETEIYFRIVHSAQVGHHGDPAAAHREQTVEIALGPKGAFENGNIGTLTRRIEADQVVSVVPLTQGNLKQPAGPKTPRVIELLRKAIEWRRQIDAGEVRNQAEIARQEGITRARVTQVMRMLHLAPEIRENILSTPNAIRRPPVTERALRPIAAISEEHEQIREFHRLLV